MGQFGVAIVAVLLCSSQINAQDLDLGWIDGLTRNIQQNVANLVKGIQSQVAEVQKEIASGNATALSGNGNTVLLNTGGNSRIIQSGRTPDGKPYVRDVSEVINGNVLRHTERIEYPDTGKSQEFGYTLDLSDPNAKPVPFNNST